jgi:hypothetical protein
MCERRALKNRQGKKILQGEFHFLPASANQDALRILVKQALLGGNKGT